MTRRVLLFGVIGVMVGFGVAWSTTVVPLSFDSVVAKAELIFVGKVVDRRSSYLHNTWGKLIVTDVTFEVVRVLKGGAGLHTKLTFLGGQVGSEALTVSGMPQFEVGDRDVLFVGNRSASNPIVGFWQGRFKIVPDPATGRDVVHTHSGVPIFEGFGGPASTAKARLFGVRAPAGELSLRDFETLVRTRVGATSARPPG